MNKAAEELYITQPSLTNAIKELERDAGITIFFRTGKGVVTTREGEEFLSYARQVYQQYELLQQRYGANGSVKAKFGVTTQHYSFAVKAFVETVKKFDTRRYEFAIRESKTYDVIQDTGNLKSEIGILYLNGTNRKIIEKLLRANELEFHKLIQCDAYVYLWKNHPLAKEKSIKFEQLQDYPCLAFEQGGKESAYFAEEILSENEYARTIKACDRATMLNLMVGLNGYTLCSGIITEELNGDDYIAVPLKESEKMRIGYIRHKGVKVSRLGEIYLDELRKYGKNSTYVL
jgi:DNA-binding transcriptional LysR family regulator